MSRPIIRSHGTRSCYQRCKAGPDGGKCDPCTAANTAYIAARRRDGRDLWPLVQERKAPPVSPLTPSQAALVADNLRLAYWFAGRARSTQVHDFDDVLSDATDGLITAAQRFDPDLGLFSSYAVLWMRSKVNAGRSRRMRETLGGSTDIADTPEWNDVTHADLVETVTPEEIVVGRLDALDRLSA